MSWDKKSALITCASRFIGSYLKGYLRRQKVVMIAYYMWDDYRTRRKFLAGNYESISGSTHQKFTVEESLAYIDTVFNDYYLKYPRLTTDDIQGKKILEIGPGDNFGVAIKFLINGADQVVSLDKFFSKRNLKQQYQIYQAMRERLNCEQRRIFDEVVNLNDSKQTVKFSEKKFKYVYGKSIEEAEEYFEPACFDFIVSAAVVEHLYDTDAAFRIMDRLLVTGGYMIHCIDLRDHGIFTGGGMHPLTFLTISDSIWKLMTYNSGRPNRRWVDYYRQIMNKLGYETKILVSHIVGNESEIIPPKERIQYNVDYFDSTFSLIKRIRPKLQRRFREMKDEDLMVAGIFLIARKMKDKQ